MSGDTANREEELFKEKVITQTAAQSCESMVYFQKECGFWKDQNEGIWGVLAGGDNGGQARPDREEPRVPSSEDWGIVDSGEWEPMKFSKQRDEWL